MNPRLLSLLLLAMFLAISCGDKPVTPPHDTPRPLKYKNEAEQLALYTTGTLLPSELLARQIDHELDLIRSTWGDSIPDVNMPFQPPWISARVSIRVDQQLYDEIVAGTNEQWMSLINDLKLNVLDYKWDWYPRLLSLIPAENMHPVRLAEHFVAFPGIEYVETGGNLQTWDDYFTRITAASGAEFLFKHNTCPDLWDAYSYFAIAGDSAIFVGVHHECFESMATYPTWESPDRFAELIDSLEAARPAWVDTVRHTLGEFEYYTGFQWHRK